MASYVGTAYGVEGQLRCHIGNELRLFHGINALAAPFSLPPTGWMAAGGDAAKRVDERPDLEIWD